MKSITSVLLGCMFILLITFISATPPVTTIDYFPSGYVITEAHNQIIKLNEDFTYNFILYNSSNGIALNDSSITCRILIADGQGNLVYSNNITYNSYDYWSVTIPGSVFNITGYFPYGVDCQDGNGGALAGLFEVTPTGYLIETGPSFVYILFIILIIGLLFGSVKLIQNNSISKDFEVSSTSYTKYKNHRFSFYMDVLKSKLYIVGIFGVYIGVLLLVTFGASLASLAGLVEIVDLLMPFTIILGWGTVPFVIFWIGYIIIYFVKKINDILMYQYGGLKR